MSSEIYSPQKVSDLPDFIGQNLLTVLQHSFSAEMEELASQATRQSPKLREFTELTAVKTRLEEDFGFYLAELRAVITETFAGSEDADAELSIENVQDVCELFIGAVAHNTAQLIGMEKVMEVILPRPADFREGMRDAIHDAIRPRYTQVFRFKRPKKETQA